MLVALALIVGAIQAGTGDGLAASWRSNVAGRQWTVNVISTLLQQAPTWSESDEAPPLSPRRAIAAARTQLPKIVDAPDRVKLLGVELVPVDARWLYLVKFSPSGGGFGQIIQLVVLMSGKALEPIPVPAGDASTTRWRMPATIRVKQDVELTSESSACEHPARAQLCVQRQAPSFVLTNGEAFQMIAVEREGEAGCRIRVAQREYDVQSCWWLDGFTDRLPDVYEVVTER